MQSRLHRSSTDKMVAGVCGGLADYFSIDPTIVRLAFVFATIAGGAGVIAYIVLAIVMPETNSTEPIDGEATISLDQESRRERSIKVAAGVLIGFGLLLLLGNTGLLEWWSWRYFWPIVLIGAGAAILLARRHQ